MPRHQAPFFQLLRHFLGPGLGYGLSAIILLGGLALSLWLIERTYQQHFLEDQHQEVRDHAAVVRARVESEIAGTLLQVQGLVAAIKVNPQLSQEDFSAYARHLVGPQSSLRNIGGAPDMVIRYMYPIKGNEAAIGLNYRNNPEQFPAAEMARLSGKVVVAGPVNLKQGGEGFISRIPVYIDNPAGEPQFWGLLSAVIDSEKFYANSQLADKTQGLQLALRGQDVSGAQGKVFWGDASLWEKSPILMDIHLPYGSWQLAAIPERGWQNRSPHFVALRLLFLGFGVMLLVPFLYAARMALSRQENEARLKALFELSPLGIALENANTGKLLDANPALLHLSGATHEHMLQRGLASFLADNAQGEDSRDFRVLRAEGRYGPLEQRWKNHDGEIKDVRLSGVLVDDGQDDAYIWSIAEDITERNKSQALLWEHKTQLELVLSSTAVGIWDWHIPSGRTLFNQRWAEIIGFSLEELGEVSIETWLRVAHPEDLPISKAKLEAHWAGETPRYICETRMRHRDGHWVWVLDSGQVVSWDAQGKPERMIGTHTDITAQKAVQSRLEASQNELKNFFDLSANFMCIASAEGIFTRVNATFSRLLGYGEAELVGQPILSFVHPDDIDATRHELQRLSQGERVLSFCNRYRKADGTYLTLLWNTTPDPETGKYYATALDVTQQQDNEQQLARQQEMMNAMSEQAFIGAWEVDLVSGKIYWSKTTRDIHEVDDDYEPTLACALDFYPPGHSRDTIDHAVKTCMETGASWNLELPIITATGREVWICATGKGEFKQQRCVRLFGSFQNINSRKISEQYLRLAHDELEQQMQLVQTIATTQSNFIAQTDTSMAFEDLLRALLQLTNSEFGFIGEMFLDEHKNPYLKTHAISNIAWDDSSREFFQKNAPAGLEFRNLKTLFGAAMTSLTPVIANQPSGDARSGGLPPGHPPLQAFLGIPIVRNHQGIAFVGLANRPGGYQQALVNHLNPLLITIGQIVENLRAQRARDHAEVLLVAAKEAAEVAVKTKGEFLAMMSHEIRTPLNGVLGMLNLLQRSALDGDQKRKVSVAKSSAESLLGIINDILDFSKVDAGKLDLDWVDFNLPNFFEDIIESMALRAQEKGLELLLDQAAIAQDWVRADAGRLRQIMTNLLGNAIKFTGQGSVIVRARVKPDGANWQLFIEVEDTGIGIAEEKIAYLFDPFTQVDASTTRQFGGTGLGLAICKKLAELMGGGISLSSQLGVGSLFRLQVPLLASSDGKARQARIDASHLQLLVVDPNPQASQALAKVLAHWGAQVHQAQDLAAAEAHLQAQGPMDAVFWDHSLPAPYALLMHSVPIIALVPMYQPATAAKSSANIFFARLLKPVTRQNIWTLLERLPACANSACVIKTASAPEQPALEAAPAAWQWPAHTRILLVEDNPVNQELAQLLLEDLGLTADLAGNGLEALSALQNAEQDPYSLILMDCQMPELDGYQTSQQVRQGKGGAWHKDVPIIAMTANAMAGDKDKCLASGMTDYISKPIHEDQLRARLMHALGGQSEPRTAVAPSPTRGPLAEWDLQAMGKSMPVKPERLHKLLATCRELLVDCASQFTVAQAQNNRAQMAFIAHSIKGSASQIRADQLAALATDLEQIYKQPDLTPDASLEQQFVEGCERMAVLIDDYLIHSGQLRSQL
jgi:PAS domain S-box-containing protein